MKAQKIKSDVFFISPAGDVVPVHDGRHINAIIKYPKVFGFHKGEIEAMYAKHGEDVGVEADAREEILIRVISQGWIRVRFIPRCCKLTFQIWKPTRRTKDNIWGFLTGIRTKKITFSYPTVNPDIVVMDTTASVVSSGELGDVIKQLYAEKSSRVPRIKQLHEFDDFTFMEYLGGAGHDK